MLSSHRLLVKESIEWIPLLYSFSFNFHNPKVVWICSELLCEGKASSRWWSWEGGEMIHLWGLFSGWPIVGALFFENENNRGESLRRFYHALNGEVKERKRLSGESWGRPIVRQKRKRKNENNKTGAAGKKKELRGESRKRKRTTGNQGRKPTCRWRMKLWPATVWYVSIPFYQIYFYKKYSKSLI